MSTKCNVLVMLEDHLDMLPTKVLTELALYLSTNGYIFLSERHHTVSITQDLEEHQQMLDTSKRVLNYPLIATITGLMVGIDFDLAYKRVYAHTKFLKNLILHNVPFKAIDPACGTSQERDQHFLGEIENVCKTHTNVVFLVGYYHNPVVIELARNISYAVVGVSTHIPPLARDLLGESYTPRGMYTYISNLLGRHLEIKTSFENMRSDPEHFKFLHCTDDDIPGCTKQVIEILSHAADLHSDTCLIPGEVMPDYCPAPTIA